MINSIDPNRQPDFILYSFAKASGQHIVPIALKLLPLHPATAPFSSLVGCCQLYTLWQTPAEETITGNKWTQGALLISSAALGYFFPFHQLVLSNGVFFVTHVHQLITADTRYDKGTALLQIAHQVIYLSSLYYSFLYRGTLPSVALSLFSQAMSEFIQACSQYGENKKNGENKKKAEESQPAEDNEFSPVKDSNLGGNLEITALVLLAIFRLYETHTYLSENKKIDRYVGSMDAFRLERLLKQGVLDEKFDSRSFNQFPFLE